jgi:FKBP-type peptidyl-prolyl cis-trans isomerase (trigger factor)
MSLKYIKEHLEILQACGTISHMEKSYTKLKKLSEKNGDIEFQAEVPVELLEEYSLAALAELAEDFALPGFRKGKVPQEKVREHIGEMELLEDAANEALRDAMAEIAEDEKLDVVGRPQVVITKIAPKNPLEFKIRYALLPDISLPDYKKIGKTIFERKDPTDVTEKEIDQAVERIQKMIASATTSAAPATTPTAPGEAPPKEVSIPPLTDETVKQFGNFNTVADFRTELKRQLEQEKVLHMKDGRREETIKEIVKHAKLKVPQLLVDQELYEFLIDRDEQLKTASLSLEKYLSQIGKTVEQLEKDERALIEDDLRMSMVVQDIRKKENLAADDRDIHSLMVQLKLRYPERKEEELHRTAEAMIIQNKLFALLEGTPTPELKEVADGDVIIKDEEVK